jgi:hypothetical protein
MITFDIGAIRFNYRVESHSLIGTRIAANDANESVCQVSIRLHSQVST